MNNLIDLGIIMKKRILIILVFALGWMGIPSMAQDDVITVAALMPSAINDLAFSQSMYDGLAAVQNELGEAHRGP